MNSNTLKIGDRKWFSRSIFIKTENSFGTVCTKHGNATKHPKRKSLNYCQSLALTYIQKQTTPERRNVCPGVVKF